MALSALFPDKGVLGMEIRAKVLVKTLVVVHYCSKVAVMGGCRIMLCCLNIFLVMFFFSFFFFCVFFVVQFFLMNARRKYFIFGAQRVQWA